MKTETMRLGLATVAAILLLVLTSTASYAGPPPAPPGAQAWLYETAERVRFVGSTHGIIFRDAVSPLMGFAAVGTPLCPADVPQNVPGVTTCTVIALGKDAVNTQTTTGPVSGTFYVVIDISSNPSVHVPDLPVISGRFDGQIGPVIPGLPLLSITGSFSIQKVDKDVVPQSFVGTRADFTGTFRIPIGDAELGVPPAAQNPDNAYYMYVGPPPAVGCFPISASLSVCPVLQSERSISFPTVRLEIQFQP
jgi:hypothetical protein